MSRARKAMCRPSGTRLLLLTLPGTAVPGYRLFRPYGTALLRPVMTLPLRHRHTFFIL
jgi:hypothetical protein